MRGVGSKHAMDVLVHHVVSKTSNVQLVPE